MSNTEEMLRARSDLIPVVLDTYLISLLVSLAYMDVGTKDQKVDTPRVTCS